MGGGILNMLWIMVLFFGVFKESSYINSRMKHFTSSNGVLVNNCYPRQRLLKSGKISRSTRSNLICRTKSSNRLLSSSKQRVRELSVQSTAHFYLASELSVHASTMHAWRC